MTTDYTVDIAVTQDKRDGFYDAVAIVKWLAIEDVNDGNDGVAQRIVERQFVTSLCRSRIRRRAISYALTEAAVAFEHGGIDP